MTGTVALFAAWFLQNHVVLLGFADLNFQASAWVLGSIDVLNDDKYMNKLRGYVRLRHTLSKSHGAHNFYSQQRQTIQIIIHLKKLKNYKKTYSFSSLLFSLFTTTTATCAKYWRNSRPHHSENDFRGQIDLKMKNILWPKKRQIALLLFWRQCCDIKQSMFLHAFLFW